MGIPESYLASGCGGKGRVVCAGMTIPVLAHTTWWGQHDKGLSMFQVFGKLLYMLSVMVQEMSRPHGKRAEWLV